MSSARVVSEAIDTAVEATKFGAMAFLEKPITMHFYTGWVGTLVAQWLTPQVLRWVVAASFLAVALWALKPDTLDETAPLSTHGAFVATVNGDLKVGAKVTIEYRMIATSAEVKTEK